MDILNRLHAWATHQLNRFRLDPAERARRQAEWERDVDAANGASPWEVLWIPLFLAMLYLIHRSYTTRFLPAPLRPNSPVSWTLDPTAPYHVIASLPGEAFTHAQVAKLEIGWDANPTVPPEPTDNHNGGERGRDIDSVNFYPFQDKLDPHYEDLIARSWPGDDKREVGVTLGRHTGIVEFVAAMFVYEPENRDGVDGGGALIERVAVAPGVTGGDRLSLPRLLKEGWVVVGKEETSSSSSSSSSSSGGYAWDGENEFEGHEEGGWKSWTAKPGFSLFKRKGNPVNRGAVPVLTLRHRPTGIMLKARQEGDAWVVRTLVGDNRPRSKAWW